MPATKDVYQQVTDRIVEKLESGVSPWQQPWKSRSEGMPRNVVSGKSYRGVNVWLLWLAAQEKGWDSNLFATFDQWKRLGGYVCRGEKGTKIVFWRIITETVVNRRTEEEEDVRRFFARQFTVFNLDQCGGEGLERFRITDEMDSEFIDFAPAEEAISATGADIRHGGTKAFYRLEGDYIQLPEKAAFLAPEGYYSTALHELVHWSGHESRLSRLDKLARFGDQSYAMEELVAEMGASFLTAALGVPNAGVENAASYLTDWLQVLKSDARAIFTASTAASAAADYVLGFSRSVEAQEHEAAIV